MSAAQTWGIIAVLGLFTAALRLGGPILARFVPATGFWRRVFDNLPDHLLLALLMPMLLNPDWRVQSAAAAAFVVARLTGGTLTAMLAGMVTVALLRVWMPI
jgi:uncharacterized membrane protein